jgi:hypothetical protein
MLMHIWTTTHSTTAAAWPPRWSLTSATHTHSQLADNISRPAGRCVGHQRPKPRLWPLSWSPSARAALLCISQTNSWLSAVQCMLYPSASLSCMTAFVCGSYISQKLVAPYEIICYGFLDAVAMYVINVREHKMAF